LRYFNRPKSTFRIDLDVPLALQTVGPAPFDSYLYAIDTGRYVHLLEVDLAYQDSNGYPFAMLLPIDWRPPLEYTDTSLAYPFFTDFIISGGSLSADWYGTPDATHVLDIPDKTTWAW